MDPQPAAAPRALPLPNCYWVLPGKLLAGEHPGGLTAEQTGVRLSRLLESGVTCFVDLTEPDEVEPYDAQLPVGIGYVRNPIRDHGLPAEPGQMADILRSLRQVLRAEGGAAYLHCRAGIGRTGTVVGCWLSEQGFAGDEALRELNRLWRQSARAEEWPELPETPAQAEYVRLWTPGAAAASDPLLEPATLAAAQGLRERFLGALLGHAMGDAVAAATQYGRPGRFAPVGDLLGGGPFDLPRGGWSDDTAIALCLAESLLEREGFDARDQVERYRRWQQDGHLSATGQCLGITAATSRALAFAKWRRQPFSGSHDPQAQDPEPLSRVTPAVMYFFARGGGVAAEQAAEAARTTCQAPLVLDACRALALGLQGALSGASQSSILAHAQLGGSPPVRAGAAAATTDSAAGALAAALDIFGRTRNFREAVLAAANLGGNCDVVGAAVGALAGAHYGAAAIPGAWRNSLIKRQLIEDCADRLLAHALLELGG